MKVYAMILAGGIGARMLNQELPKQYMLLGDKPILIHTLEQFLYNPKFVKVLIGCPKDWKSYTQDLIEKYIPDSGKIDVIIGGATGRDTMMNGCKHIEKEYGIEKDDIIVAHDAIRPFVTQRIINDNIKAVGKYGACDTAIPAADTIVQSKDGKVLHDIPVRSECFQGQMPQSFNIKKLMKVYSSLTTKEKDILTDLCKIFVIKKEKVSIVEGETFNIKITVPNDLKLANALLSVRDK